VIIGSAKNLRLQILDLKMLRFDQQKKERNFFRSLLVSIFTLT
jgi:hypothetical protein